MTKLITFAIVVVLAMSTMATAGDWMEVRSITPTATYDVSPQFVTNLDGSIKGPLGWNGWAVVGAKWSEAYIGPTLSTKTMGIGVSAGIESGGHLRLGSTGWLAKGRVLAVGTYETGAARWYKLTVDYKVQKHLKVGYQDQLGAGRGPRIVATFGRVMVWSALLVKDGKSTIIATARFSR